MLKHGNTKFGVGVLTKGHQFHCSKLKPLLMLPFLMANTPLPSSPQTSPLLCLENNTWLRVILAEW